jgi:Type II secretion system (T2SS), protein K
MTSILSIGKRSRSTGPKRKSGGAAIMLALWALFLLSALVISWALDIDTRLSISGEGNRMLKAEAAACSGAEIALHPLVKPNSPNLHGQISGGANYDARITGENGRLNINWLAAFGPEDPEKLEILRRYLEAKGIDLDERNTMVDSLLDWLRPDTGLHHLNAPPESSDYHPAHAPLARVDELKNVAGWQDFTSQPDWDNDFTVNGSGPVDLIWASREVLLSLPGMTPQIVDRFLELRRGPDGVDGTQDDTVFKSNDEVMKAMGFNQDQVKQLQAFITPQPNMPPFRVVSVGTAGTAKRTVQMVFNRTNPPAIITWKEF